MTIEKNTEGSRLFNRLYETQGAADGYRYSTLAMEGRKVRVAFPTTEEARKKAGEILHRLPVYAAHEMPRGQRMVTPYWEFDPEEVNILRQIMEDWGLVNCRLTRSNGGALAYVGYMRILINNP